MAGEGGKFPKQNERSVLRPQYRRRPAQEDALVPVANRTAGENSTQNMDPGPAEERSYGCPEIDCDENFSSYMSLQHHVLTEHDSNNGDLDLGQPAEEHLLENGRQQTNVNTLDTQAPGFAPAFASSPEEIQAPAFAPTFSSSPEEKVDNTDNPSAQISNPHEQQGQRISPINIEDMSVDPNSTVESFKFEEMNMSLRPTIPSLESTIDKNGAGEETDDPVVQQELRLKKLDKQYEELTQDDWRQVVLAIMILMIVLLHDKRRQEMRRSHHWQQWSIERSNRKESESSSGSSKEASPPNILMVEGIAEANAQQRTTMNPFSSETTARIPSLPATSRASFENNAQRNTFTSELSAQIPNLPSTSRSVLRNSNTIAGFQGEVQDQRMSFSNLENDSNLINMSISQISRTEQSFRFDDMSMSLGQLIPSLFDRQADQDPNIVRPSLPTITIAEPSTPGPSTQIDNLPEPGDQNSRIELPSKFDEMSISPQKLIPPLETSSDEDNAGKKMDDPVIQERLEALNRILYLFDLDELEKPDETAHAWSQWTSRPESNQTMDPRRGEGGGSSRPESNQTMEPRRGNERESSTDRREQAANPPVTARASDQIQGPSWSDPDAQFVCPVLTCRRKCATLKILRDHKRYHDNLIKCPLCDRFERPCAMSKHLRSHHPDQVTQCPWCKSWILNDKLDEHQRISCQRKPKNKAK